MTSRWILLVLFSGLSLHANAENGCPAGYEPWKIPVESSSDCMAIPDDGQTTGPAAIEQQWVSRWGAIAIGSTASGGGVGTSTDMASRRKAESQAIKACRDTGGGSQCKVFSYHDQCAVVAWGAASYVVQSAESIEHASGVALERCGKKTEDCEIFYSACSLPQRKR